MNVDKIMSIGSNCACIGFLGNSRVRGPVDNVISKRGIFSSKALFNNTLYDEIMNAEPVISEHIKTALVDDGFQYEYSNHIFIHNNPTTDKFKTEFKRRIDNFNNFYKKLRDGNNYFTYSLGVADIDNNKATLLFKLGLDILKYYGIFDRTIIVGTRRVKKEKLYWNFQSDEVVEICNDNGVKYIEIEDCNVYHPDETKKQFYEKIALL